MRTGSLVLWLVLAPLLLSARSGPGAISGKVANADGAVRIVATSLDTGEQFSSTANVAGEFTLASLPPGAYRVVMRNEQGTSVARRLVKVQAGAAVRLEARLDEVLAPGPAGKRARVRAAAAASASPTDLPPIMTQFEESSRYLNAVTLVDDNNGWAVGDPRWDQATRQVKGTIIRTTDGGVTWSNQDPGGTDVLNNVFFLNANLGWVVGDNGTILRTTDGGAHWTRSPVSTGADFQGIAFIDASNGWATGDTPIQYAGADVGFSDFQASIWHTTDGGQTWSPQSVPSSAALLKRVTFVNANTGFAAGLKVSGYDSYGGPQFLGAIYGTTDGGHTWNEVFATSAGFTFTSLYFTDASNGWAAGFPHASDYGYAFTFHTTDGGKTWQPQKMGGFYTQVRDIHMLDSSRGYAAGTDYVGEGSAVWRTSNGGATWNRISTQNANPYTVEGYWGVALTANRVLTVGDRDATAWASHPMDACTGDDPSCPALLTQAYISPHYIFYSVFSTDRNHGWVVGTRTFDAATWGQAILVTQDGGQTWTTQYEQKGAGPGSYHRLESVWFADANNGWAVGSPDMYPTPGFSVNLACIIHTADGGKTWTDQSAVVCKYDGSEFAAVQFFDAQNGWALSASELYSTIQLAHTTDGGNHWAMVDTGIPGTVNVGWAIVNGGMHFSDTQHGCAAGWDVVVCTSDGGAHWAQVVVDCGFPGCVDGHVIAFADALHGWLGAGALYQSTDGGAHWSNDTPQTSRGGSYYGLQFTSPSTGWLAGHDGYLFQTTDSGAHWLPVNSGTGVDLLGLEFTDAQHGWIVGDFGTILNYAADRTPAGKPALFSALNAASYTASASPNAWISLFGANLSASTRTWAAGDFIDNKLPTQLDGVSVTVNGNPAYLSYISPGQINAMFPDGGSTGQVSVQVTNSQGSSGTLPVQKTGYSPALFRLSVEQGNYVIAQTTDGKLVGNFDIGYDLGTPSQVRDAKQGEIVTLYGTGFGPTNPALPSGTVMSSYAQLASPVTFSIGGTAAPVILGWTDWSRPVPVQPPSARGGGQRRSGDRGANRGIQKPGGLGDLRGPAVSAGPRPVARHCPMEPPAAASAKGLVDSARLTRILGLAVPSASPGGAAIAPVPVARPTAMECWDSRLAPGPATPPAWAISRPQPPSRGPGLHAVVMPF